MDGDFGGVDGPQDCEGEVFARGRCRVRGALTCDASGISRSTWRGSGRGWPSCASITPIRRHRQLVRSQHRRRGLGSRLTSVSAVGVRTCRCGPTLNRGLIEHAGGAGLRFHRREQAPTSFWRSGSSEGAGASTTLRTVSPGSPRPRRGCTWPGSSRWPPRAARRPSSRFSTTFSPNSTSAVRLSPLPTTPWPTGPPATAHLSVGDVLVLGETAFAVARFGFDVIPTTALRLATGATGSGGP